MKQLLTKAEFNGIELPKINKDQAWDIKKTIKFMSQTGITIRDPARDVKIIHIDKDGHITREETITS